MPGLNDDDIKVKQEEEEEEERIFLFPSSVLLKIIRV